MATEKTKIRSKLQGGDVVLKPVPPGRKSRGRLPRPGDPEPSKVRQWVLIAVAVIGILVVGIAVGRFLVP